MIDYPTDMKNSLISAVVALVCAGTMAAFFPLSSEAKGRRPEDVVRPGIEVLESRGFDCLRGKRVGLVTNPSGVDRNMRSTIDILYNAPGVELVALYGPEHGVRGNVYAGGKVTDTKDPATGLPVYSLYGATRKPTPEMLKGIDVMVYDIQDVGVRSYTFISTLGLVMEACSEQGIEVVVLDRPNPLGGDKIEGPYVQDGYFSFVSQYEIPYIYGMTVGELALLINGKGLNRGQLGDREQPERKRDRARTQAVRGKNDFVLMKTPVHLIVIVYDIHYNIIRRIRKSISIGIIGYAFGGKMGQACLKYTQKAKRWK